MSRRAEGLRLDVEQLAVGLDQLSSVSASVA